MSDAGFELCDHTADLGLRVFAPTRGELVQQAASALMASIGVLRTAGASREESFEFRGDDPPVLLRDLLARLLWLFETQHQATLKIRVDGFDGGRLSGTATLAAIDEPASELEREVKAITYHDLRLDETQTGFEFYCIVDI